MRLQRSLRQDSSSHNNIAGRTRPALLVPDNFTHPSILRHAHLHHSSARETPPAPCLRPVPPHSTRFRDTRTPESPLLDPHASCQKKPCITAPRLRIQTQHLSSFRANWCVVIAIWTQTWRMSRCRKHTPAQRQPTPLR